MFRRGWAGLALAVAALAAGTPAGAQSKGRPAAPSTAPATLDRSLFPFFPLRADFLSNLEIGPTVTPALGPAGLYMPLRNGDLALYDGRTGRFQWATPIRPRQGLVPDGDRLLVTADDALTSLASADGKTVWTSPLPGPSAHAPVARDGWVLIALADGTLRALRSEDGKTVWTHALASAATTPPVFEGDRLYAGTRGGALASMTVSTGAPRWSVRLDGDVTALAAVEGHVFAATAARWLYALDARNGETRWRYRVAGAAIGLAVDEDRVIAVMLDQSVRAWKIGSGAQAWRYPLSFRPAAGPIVVGGSVLVTGYAPSVRVIDRRTGANQGVYAMPVPTEPGAMTLETLAAGPMILLGPTVFDDRLALVTQQGWIHVARRQFDPPATPITVLPGDPLPVPSPPPGWKPPPPAEPPAAPAAPATAPTGAAAPSSTPPAPPGR